LPGEAQAVRVVAIRVIDRVVLDQKRERAFLVERARVLSERSRGIEDEQRCEAWQ
jgi:hypothetical protein